MSYNDDDKEIKIGGEEDDDADFEEDPNDPLNDPLIEDDDLVGTDENLYDGGFAGLDGSEY